MQEEAVGTEGAAHRGEQRGQVVHLARVRVEGEREGEGAGKGAGAGAGEGEG